VLIGALLVAGTPGWTVTGVHAKPPGWVALEEHATYETASNSALTSMDALGNKILSGEALGVGDASEVSTPRPPIKGQSGWVNPDAWMDNPDQIQDISAFLLAKNSGFSHKLPSGFWVDVATEHAPATPLADLTTSYAELCDELYGFPDGVVDESDLRFFVDSIFGTTTIITKTNGTLTNHTLTDHLYTIGGNSITTFMESYVENFGIMQSPEAAYEVVTATTEDTLSWAYRIKLLQILRDLCKDGNPGVLPVGPDTGPGETCAPEVGTISWQLRAFIEPSPVDKIFNGCGGNWRKEPAVPGLGLFLDTYYYKNDNRKVCEDGTSRLTVVGAINSNEIGDCSSGDPLSIKSRVVATCGVSHRYYESEGVCRSNTATPILRVDVRDRGPYRTHVTVFVSAAYPFSPAANTPGLASISAHIELHFLVLPQGNPAPGQAFVRCGQVFYDISGRHGKFPSWDGFLAPAAAESCVYQYNARDLDPSMNQLVLQTPFKFPKSPINDKLICR
jgi:hypothetical protein